jgi:hypothetical protein
MLRGKKKCPYRDSNCVLLVVQPINNSTDYYYYYLSQHYHRRLYFLPRLHPPRFPSFCVLTFTTLNEVHERDANISLLRTVALSGWGLLRHLTHSLVGPVINHRIPPSNTEGIMIATFSSVFTTRPTFLGHVLILSPHYLLCVSSGSFPKNFLTRVVYAFLFPESPSQWLRGLKHELSSLARILGSWVRIPLKPWMSVFVYSVFVLSYLQVEVLRRADLPSKESYGLCIGKVKISVLQAVEAHRVARG